LKLPDGSHLTERVTPINSTVNVPTYYDVPQTNLLVQNITVKNPCVDPLYVTMFQDPTMPVPYDYEYVIGSPPTQIVYINFEPLILISGEFLPENCGTVDHALYYNDTLVTPNSLTVFSIPGTTTLQVYTTDISLTHQTGIYKI